MRFVLLVTGPAYGTQNATTALQFAQALLREGHSLHSIFFYREGVLNANELIAPASDEFHILQAWQQLQREHEVALNVCVAAALRRGVIDKQQAEQQQKCEANLAEGFVLTGLGALAEAVIMSERVVQF
ncbi:MAG: Sulfurtransferase TusD [Candidatus Erwinia impunctatus]|nr:Sulfurtransferase TusD [Culicoides impunctatus]